MLYDLCVYLIGEEWIEGAAMIVFLLCFFIIASLIGVFVASKLE